MFKFLKSHVMASVGIYGGSTLLLMAAFWVAYQYADPLPPSRVVVAAGGKTGAYYRHAQLYAEAFAREGVELVVLETSGSMDNLARMATTEEALETKDGEGAPQEMVDAAFMQGGIASAANYPHLRSLGSLYYEPLWVFHARKSGIRNLTDLRGRTVAIGPAGSGTNTMARRMLTDNGVTPDNSILLETGYADVLASLSPGGDKAVRPDAVFTIAGADSTIVETLGGPDSAMDLYSFDRAEAYARHYRFLNRLTLPEGSLNLARNVPGRDVNLLATTANLVVRDDLHPAIKYLFLLAASEVHGSGDLFSRPGEFPNKEASLFPLSDEAERFYSSGPPLLMRYLPYSLAIIFERLKILLIPLLTLLYPLFKITPPAYRWQIRRRIFRWYKDLKDLDTEAYSITTREEARAMLRRLETLDRMVLETSVPLSYSDNIYSLRIHIHLIQDRMEKLCARLDQGAETEHAPSAG
jgi:TRAP transporter TAXI family solute receptor